MATKPEGRPRDESISHAILQSAIRRMETEGFGKLTVDGIVKDVGTTRQTFYRRYGSTAELALEVISDRFSYAPPLDTGTLQNDLLSLQRQDIAMMSSALIRKNLPGLIGAMQINPTARRRYFEDIVAPKKMRIRSVLTRAEERGEIDSVTVDVGFLCDLLFGPLLSRTLLPSDYPLDDQLARSTVSAALLAIEHSY